MNTDIVAYNKLQAEDMKAICDFLAESIESNAPKFIGKIWHGGPVWFMDGNPIVGYWVRKSSVQLLFWSGQSFNEAGLSPEGSFKAAEIRYTSVDQINLDDLKRWLVKAEKIQWDYKNIVKRKGTLKKLTF